MAGLSKPHASVTDDTEKGVMRDFNATQEENAVGYKEYVAGRDIDYTEKEVGENLSIASAFTDDRCNL